MPVARVLGCAPHMVTKPVSNGEAKECQRVGDFDKGYNDSPGPREGGNRAAVGCTQRCVVLWLHSMYTYTHADRLTWDIERK